MLETEGNEPPELEEFLCFLELKRQDLERSRGLSHLDYISKKDIKVKESPVYKVLSYLWKVCRRM